jgi:hypothetical protein
MAANSRIYLADRVGAVCGGGWMSTTRCTTNGVIVEMAVDYDGRDISLS